MKTHRIAPDGVFMPRILNRPDGSRLVNTSHGRWRREWRHSDGHWRDYPVDRDELRRNQMIEEDDDYAPAGAYEPRRSQGAALALIAGAAVLVFLALIVLLTRIL